MIKKFFSIFLLVTAFVVTGMSAKSLTVTNKNNTTIEHVVITFAKGMLSEKEQICVRILEPNKTGISELGDLKSLKLYNVDYVLNGSKVSLDFKGAEVFLPLDINLTDITTNTVTYTDNAEARQKAEEAKLINQAAAVARNAKNQVAYVWENAKDLVAGAADTASDAATIARAKLSDAASTIKEKATEVTHNAARTIVEKTESVTPHVNIDTTAHKIDTNANVGATRTVQAEVLNPIANIDTTTIRKTDSNLDVEATRQPVRPVVKVDAVHANATSVNTNDAINAAKDKATDVTHTVAQTVADVAQSVADKTDNASASTNFSGKLEEATDTAKEKLHRGEHRAQEAGLHLLNRGKEIVEQVKDTVKEAV